MLEGDNTMSHNFLSIPMQKDMFTPVRIEGAADDEDEEEDFHLIPRCSPVPRKRGPSIADETAEYMRIREAFKRRVSFADSSGGELVDVRLFNAFDSDDEESAARWEAEESRYRAAIREPIYHPIPDFQELSADELKTSVLAGKVEVERVTSVPDEPLAFSGTIRVLNISFNKSVYIRSTMDGWGSYFDYMADYVESSTDGDTDQFSFKLSFAPPYLFDGARIDFVVRYETSNGEFWANNSGKNYSVTLRVTYEDSAAKAAGTDVSSIRGILRPPRPGLDYDCDSSDEDDEKGASRPEREVKPEQPAVIQPVIIHPGMDIDVRRQEKESLSTSSTDLLQTTAAATTVTAATTTAIAATPEATPCFVTATEVAPSLPAAEMSPGDRQEQPSTALPQSDTTTLESEPNYALEQPMPAAQIEVGEGEEVPAVPACFASVMALSPDAHSEDHSGSLATGDTHAVLAARADIPRQLGHPQQELTGPNPTEVDLHVSGELDVLERGLEVVDQGIDIVAEGIEHIAEDLSVFEAELGENKEETDTGKELVESQGHTLTISADIFEDRLRKESADNLDVEMAGIEEDDVPKDLRQLVLWTGVSPSLSTHRQVDITIHDKPTDPETTDEYHMMTHGPRAVPYKVPDTVKPPAPVQPSKASVVSVSEPSLTKHEALPVASPTGPVELKETSAEEISQQYFSVTAPSTKCPVGTELVPEAEQEPKSELVPEPQPEMVYSTEGPCPMLTPDMPEDKLKHTSDSTEISQQYFTVTTPSTKHPVAPVKDALDISDFCKEELVSFTEVSCPVSIPDVPEDKLEHPSDSSDKLVSFTESSIPMMTPGALEDKLEHPSEPVFSTEGSYPMLTPDVLEDKLVHSSEPLSSPKVLEETLEHPSDRKDKLVSFTESSSPMLIPGVLEDRLEHPSQLVSSTEGSCPMLTPDVLEDTLERPSDSMDKLVSLAEGPCPMSIPDVLEDKLEHPPDYMEDELDAFTQASCPIATQEELEDSFEYVESITLRPAIYGLSVAVGLLAAMQEPSLLYAYGLYLMMKCF